MPTGPRGPVEPPVTVAAGRSGRGRTAAIVGAAALLVAGGVTAAVLWPEGGQEPRGAASGAPVPAPRRSTGPSTTSPTASPTAFRNDGALDGVTGIHPGAELTPEFEQRVLGIEPDLQYLDYSAESYDAAILVALAASMARSTDAQEFKDLVNGLTYGGGQCADYASCLAVIEEGGNPNFDGASGPLDFTADGEPARATFAVVQIGADNRVAVGETEFVTAGDPGHVGGADDGLPRGGDAGTQEPLVLGTLLPLSGNLQYLGPSAEAGVRLAVQEINAAGGVLGLPIELVTEENSGDLSTDTADRTVDRLLAGGVDAIVGAVASSVSLEVTRAASRQQMCWTISPANTSNESDHRARRRSVLPGVPTPSDSRPERSPTGSSATGTTPSGSSRSSPPTATTWPEGSPPICARPASTRTTSRP